MINTRHLWCFASSCLLAACSPSHQAHGPDAAVDAEVSVPFRDAGRKHGPDAALADAMRDTGQARDVSVSEDANDLSFKPSPDCVHPPVARACEEGLCTIPAGCFVLGTARDARSAASLADREVEVRLTHAFLIGETEITRAQWLALGLPAPDMDWRKTGSADPNVPPPEWEQCNDPQCPVTWVGYEDAMAYANLRSEAEELRPCYVLGGCVRSPGHDMRCSSVRIDAESPYACEGYRLPTEAEWEYATRAGTRTDYYSGDMAPDEGDQSNCNFDANLDRIAWYCGNSATLPKGADGGGRAHPVAQKEPNGFGLYDVSGNAYEWVNDRISPSGYGAGPLIDPVFGVVDPSDLTPTTGTFSDGPGYLGYDGFPGHRVRRGGSFDFWPILAASGWRLYSETAIQCSGFRIARTIHATVQGSRDE